jgi:hypothetical protein
MLPVANNVPAMRTESASLLLVPAPARSSVSLPNAYGFCIRRMYSWARLMRKTAG